MVVAYGLEQQAQARRKLPMLSRAYNALIGAMGPSLKAADPAALRGVEGFDRVLTRSATFSCRSIHRTSAMMDLRDGNRPQ